VVPSKVSTSSRNEWRSAFCDGDLHQPGRSPGQYFLGPNATWWAAWNVVANDIGEKDMCDRKRGAPDVTPKKSKASAQAALYASMINKGAKLPSGVKRERDDSNMHADADSSDL
jgi:hypothetical protein